MKFLLRFGRPVAGVFVAALLCVLAAPSISYATTLLHDDFSDGNNFGWTTTLGEWDATSGYNEATGLDGGWAYTYAGNASWDNYTFDVDITFGTGNTEFIVAVRVDPTSLPGLVGGRQYYLSVDGGQNF